MVTLEAGELFNPQWSLILGSKLGTDAIARLKRLLSAIEGSDPLNAMVETHRRLGDCAKKVEATLEGYLLLHYIRGTCSLCKKLGGR